VIEEGTLRFVQIQQLPGFAIEMHMCQKQKNGSCGQHDGQKALSVNPPLIWLINYPSH